MTDYTETVEFSVVRAAASAAGASISATYSAWSTYSTITIANPPAVSDYPVRIAVTFAAGMKADFSDLRFTNVSDAALSYWIESSTASTSAVVWVKVAASTASIRMFYGNVSATSESNGAAVFDFYDDFSGATIDTTKWNTNGTVTLTNGVMAGQISGKVSFGAGYSLCGTARWPTATTGRVFTWGTFGDVFYGWNAYTGGQWYLECNSPYSYTLNKGTLDTNFHKFEIKRTSPSSCGFYRDGAYYGDLYGPTANLPPGLITGTGEWKTVYVRKFTATEPACTVGSPSSTGIPATPYTTATTTYHETIEFGRVVTPSIGPAAFGCTIPFSVVRSPTVAGGTAYRETVEFSVVRVPDPPRTVQMIDFSGTKAGTSTVRRGITDSFWTLNQAIDEAQTLSLETLKGTKVIRQDKAGIEHCVFFGLLPDVSYQLAYCADGTNVVGYDYGWYLSEQNVPANLLVLPATQEPSTWIRAVLGGDNWERKTGVMPYRLHPISAWGTTIPAKEFPFKRNTPISKAIKEITDYYGAVFFTKWQNFGPICSVNSPDPSRRLIVIGAADYDPTSGTGYADYEPANLGGAYRPNEGVDVELFATEKGHSVGWIRNGEWLKFTRSFPWSGQYALSFRVACMGSACYFTVSIDGVLLSTVHTGADYLTGDYSVFTNTNPDADGTIATLTAGSHEIRIDFYGNIGDAPNNQHQNLASITCTPRPAATEGTLTDDVFTPAAYLLAETELDSTTDGLDLPAPRTFTNPSDSILNNVKVAQRASNACNRVVVGGHNAQGVWWWVTRETAAVSHDGELAREISESPDRCTTVALTEAYADDLLEYYQLDQQTYDLSVDQGMDLQPYQKVRFVGYSKIPAGWCRIVDITYHCEYLNDYAEISVIPVERMIAQGRLYRSLFATNATITESIVNAAISAQPGILVGTVSSVNGASAVVAVESGSSITTRCT